MSVISEETAIKQLKAKGKHKEFDTGRVPRKLNKHLYAVVISYLESPDILASKSGYFIINKNIAITALECIYFNNKTKIPGKQDLKNPNKKPRPVTTLNKKSPLIQLILDVTGVELPMGAISKRNWISLFGYAGSPISLTDTDLEMWMKKLDIFNEQLKSTCSTKIQTVISTNEIDELNNSIKKIMRSIREIKNR